MMGRKTRKPHIRPLAAAAMVALCAWIGPSLTEVGAPAAQESAAGFQTISSEQLEGMLRDKDFPLVNVHIPYEGEIAQTDAFIPFDQIGDHLDQLPTDKSAAIVLYCKSGRMSEIAAGELAALGYSNVSHLDGGMVDWEKSGRTVLRN